MIRGSFNAHAFPGSGMVKNRKFQSVREDFDLRICPREFTSSKIKIGCDKILRTEFKKFPATSTIYKTSCKRLFVIKSKKQEWIKYFTLKRKKNLTIGCNNHGTNTGF